MPFRICKSFEIENGHMLSKHPDKCKFPHGHSRKVEVVFEAHALDGHEMVCDFKAIKDMIGHYLDRFDHAMCINTADPQYTALHEAYGDQIIGFNNLDPTTEVLAEHFFRETKSALAAAIGSGTTTYPVNAGVRLASVRVWETSSSWAEYSE